jgi:L-asparaginase II
MRAVPLVRVLRSGLEESVHHGHVVVCDARGRLLAWAGDPDAAFYARSCMKPVQAAVSFASMPSERLTDRLAAIACSSHNGEPTHVKAVRDLLRRGRLGTEALQTPPGLPIDRDSAAKAGGRSPLLHNCSGKHAAMLLACVRAGWPVETYRSKGHPLQRRVLAAVRLLSGEDPVVGVDGCGVPVHGLSLRSIATMYARLSDPSSQGELAPHLGRALDAMRTQPYMVGGRERDDTALMQAVPGLVAKEGAEALDCAVDLGAGIGVAVKVADGGERAAGPALLAVLDQLGSIPRGARQALGPFAAPPVMGGGRPVGRLEAVVRLRSR